ncbi:MAG: hypothetical protein JW874_06840 [Spirochaetales bacterium]|nr:hypothetical protein [Spirochaetales bacterium]
MDKVHTSLSTGLPHLDDVFQGVRSGDNIVWQVNSIEDYIPFVHPFCREAVRETRDLIYFRFADHAYLLPEDIEAEIHVLHPENGFENFISEIFDIIEKHGTGACYVFDCLSELTVDWYSDRMLGNFFMLTCPYLYDFETATYFALIKNHHMSYAIQAIHKTAQIVVDVYRNKGCLYIHPLKVYKRYSPTMYMLHCWKDDNFTPVNNSTIISEIMSNVPQPWLDFTIKHEDVWTRTFNSAQSLQSGDEGISGRYGEKSDTYRKIFDRILRMAITRDEKIIELAHEYFFMEDLLNIGKRMVGTGLIGGKSVGMLLARAILKHTDPSWINLLEAHDSFFIGADLFYSYLIENRCWWLRRRLINKIRKSKSFDTAEEVRLRLLHGKFSDEVRAQFMNILDYYGQSPIIVRSSSLLEDAYGNAFSGKYESVFCTNQGTPEERLEEFMSAVRTVYSSTLQTDALAYRDHWNLLDQDEQMALLVQRVSGARYEKYFFPQCAGVGFSFNPYVWNRAIDPAQGLIRLVFGLGTRAVDRADDDYTRIVSLSAPELRPESNKGDVRRYSQRKVDLLNLWNNKHCSVQFENIATLPEETREKMLLAVFASIDYEAREKAREYNLKDFCADVLTFDELLANSRFVTTMKNMLAILQKAYHYPVDIEFACNFTDRENFRINVLQCRPFQVKGNITGIKIPENIDPAKTLFKSEGPIIGNSALIVAETLIFVVPSEYGALSVNDRYSIARLIGRLTHLEKSPKENSKIVLLGPGRWGTAMPSLGVPVSFQEIKTVSIICEIAAMHEGLIPDVSLGTHFFNDLVEMDIQYIALDPDQKGHFYNEKLLRALPNELTNLLPEAETWSNVVKVFTSRPGKSGQELFLGVNSMTQECVCYLKEF